MDLAYGAASGTATADTMPTMPDTVASLALGVFHKPRVKVLPPSGNPEHLEFLPPVLAQVTAKKQAMGVVTTEGLGPAGSVGGSAPRGCLECGPERYQRRQEQKGDRAGFASPPCGKQNRQRDESPIPAQEQQHDKPR
jgi:hypothetical protein